MRKAAPSGKSMNKKIKWALVVAVLGTAEAAAWVLWPRDSVSLETYQRIRLGMTLEEVEELLDAPGQTCESFNRQLAQYDVVPIATKHRFDEGSGEITIDGDAELCATGPRAAIAENRSRYWFGRQGAIRLTYGDDGRIETKSFHVWRTPSFWERLRSWVGCSGPKAREQERCVMNKFCYSSLSSWSSATWWRMKLRTKRWWRLEAVPVCPA
jgi:hypothetical protein